MSNRSLLESEEEYDAFRRWYLNGSIIEQRMNDGPGTEPYKIPYYWEGYKDVLTARNVEDLPDNIAKFETLYYG